MLPLLGIAIVVVGFALRINPLAVVVAAAITTGLAAHHGLVDVISAFGKGFVDSRSVAVVWLALPVIGLLESAGLKERARIVISRVHAATVGRLLLAYLAVRGQVGLKNLDNTEQFRLGGPDGVRAFAPGEGTGDSGVIGSLELRFLPPESIFGRIGRESVISLFYDVGRIKYRKDPTAEIAHDDTFVNTATLGGAGVAATWVRPGEFALRLSVASRTQGTPKSDTKGGSTRAYAQLTYFIK